MILARKFTPSEDNDYEHLASAGGRLRAVLDAFADGRLPPDYGPEQLAAYARSLLAAQRADGSFSSSSNPEILEDDLRDEAHRFVTWSAAAFLSLYEEESGSLPPVEGLKAAVERALNSSAASDLSFPSSGPAEIVQQLEAILILASGRIPARLESGACSASELAMELKRLRAEIRDRVDAGNTSLPGGFDYQPLFLDALRALES